MADSKAGKLQNDRNLNFSANLKRTSSFIQQSEGFTSLNRPESSGAPEPALEIIQPKFTFIQVETNHGPRTEARSHVMRHFWQERKRMQKTKKSEVDRQREVLLSLKSKGTNNNVRRDILPRHSSSCSDNESHAVAGTTLQSKKLLDSKRMTGDDSNVSEGYSDPSSQVSNLALKPLCRTAITEVDPFTRYNFGDDPEMKRLLHYYAWITASCMDVEAASVDFARVGWLFSRVAMLDPEPSHIIIGFTMHHMARLRGQPEPPLAIHHKMNGMLLINARLNDPEQAISDGNIGAVASLSSHELLSGAPEDFAIHMLGLDKMVKARGGLIAFDNNRPLRLVLESLDLCRSYIRIQRPSYSMYDDALMKQLAMIGIVQSDALRTQVAMMQARNDFCVDFIRVVDGLEKATRVIKNTASLELPTKEWITFSDSICSKAMEMSWDSLAEEVVDVGRRITRKCFRLASLIYLQTALQEFRNTPPNTGTFFRKCRYRLLDTTKDWGRAIEMLACVILRGERSEVERHRRAWYVANSIIESQEVMLDTWKIVEETLLGYMRSVDYKYHP